MSLVLALETSTDHCSAALLEDDHLLAEIALERPRVHAERLTSLVHRILDCGDRSMDEVHAVAVSEGPGSYTGLRIGASTAKGLAESRDCTLIAVPSLEAVAASATAATRQGDAILVLRHARADEYFVAGFRVKRDSHGTLRPDPALPTRVVDLDELPGALEVAGRSETWAAGTAEEWPSHVIEALDLRTALLPEGRSAPSAFWTGWAAGPRLREDEREDVATYEPAYGRPFQTNPRRPLFDRLSEEP